MPSTQGGGMKSEKKNTRPVIYQLLVRTFGNMNETRKPGGSISENGCGKFSDIDEVALSGIAEMGFTHIWLTGVLEQASGTAYPGRPADVPDILKGIAGSPYAIKDYFDVCPDYADHPEDRLEEFRELVARCHAAGFRVIIDFVPNHVARSYRSDVHPELSFGEGDRTDVFFDRENHFYYLSDSDPGGGPPLILPTEGMPGCTGHFELEEKTGKVTGNNAITWRPAIHDWYETLKLNYGHDFTTGRATAHLPGTDADPAEVPKTWRTMDSILAYWQGFGVDGFRVDMAHIVPMEFWRWVVARARGKNPEVFFMAEAYDTDPDKLTDEDVLEELWKAGFDGAYEHPTYKILQGIYESGKWANDIDAETFGEQSFHHCIRYLENHDEVRIANPQCWGGVGMEAGRPAAAVMFGISKAAIMIYAGQEIGEPAVGAEGFSGDDGRSSIFDYTSLPEFQKWTNGGKFDGAGLSKERKNLREWYADLLALLRGPAFTNGGFHGLNHANLENPKFGRADGESHSGHWLYAFLRSDPGSGQAFLCLANFHPERTLTDVEILIPDSGMEMIGRADADSILLEDGFGNGSAEIRHGVTRIGDIEPFGVRYFELK